MFKFTLFPFVFITYFCICLGPCLSADCHNVLDSCPTNTTLSETIFINGYPCKNPSNITASDFKTSMLNHRGDTDNYYSSSVTILTALEFPGLNTLGLSPARTDLDVGGLVLPHSHPRASEMAFVSKGVVLAGFIDTNNQIFQNVLKEGDVFVFPRGLLHFCLNAGFEEATVFSVLNSQNPGVVSIASAVFGGEDSEVMRMAMANLISVAKVEQHDQFDNATSLFKVNFVL